ncbi:MAG: hypothetical protein C0433_17890, partial [Cyclobacterium sp.]|nr:hypothetical protein [Cyclobacterium sp.]
MKVGILIIGSLLWSNDNNPNDNIRKIWRDENLIIKDKIHVKVPIRYERISKNNITTMIFSNSMKKKEGLGYIVPIKKNITNSEELEKEIQDLSSAEGLKGNITGNWGTICYLKNKAKLSNNDRKIIDKI